uniref:Uncharacterized protein n=1 Tax=Anguilla anguilla TaxID=7936 RepID=A0A0E9UL74_ANGAN
MFDGCTVSSCIRMLVFLFNVCYVCKQTKVRTLYFF